MCKYTFWKDSVFGLNEELTIEAENYIQAREAVNKHICRQAHKLTLVHNDVIVKVQIACNDCGQIYQDYAHIDPVGNKNRSVEQLIECALCKNSKYKSFQKLHSKHTLQEGGWFKASGV